MEGLTEAEGLTDEGIPLKRRLLRKDTRLEDCINEVTYSMPTKVAGRGGKTFSMIHPDAGKGLLSDQHNHNFDETTFASDTP